MLYRILADKPDFFLEAFLDENGFLNVDGTLVDSTSLVEVNHYNGLVTRIEGADFALTAEGVVLGGTVSSLSVEDGTTTIGTITGVDWDLAALVDALQSAVRYDFAPLAALFNETAPITIDASMATDLVDTFDIPWLVVGLVDGLIYEDSEFHDFVVGTSGDDQFTVSGGSDYSYNVFAATDGNDLYDFAGANRRVYAVLDYGQRFGSTPTAITATIDGLTDTGSIQAGGFTDTITGIANKLVGQGFGLWGSTFGDTFNVVQVQDGWIDIIGGEGSDTYNLTLTDGGTVALDFSSRPGQDPTRGIVVDLSSGSIQDDGYGTSDTLNLVDNGGLLEIRATDFADSITGSARDERFAGHQGDDTINGGQGWDTICYDWGGVGPVNVNLVTGVATGTWRGEAFRHTLSGIEEVHGSVTGDDTILGGTADELFDGDGGDDWLDGGAGRDRLYGKDGNDTLRGGDGRDLLHGGQGDDRLDASGGSAGTQEIGDIVAPGTGRDTIIGHEAAWRAGDNGGLDLIYRHVTGTGGMVVTIGADGSGTAVSNVAGVVDDSFTFVDYVGGTHQSDRLSGSDNWESFVGQGGNDTIDGGGGSDFLEYWREEGATQGVVVDLSSSTATDSTGGTDTLANIEGAVGTVFSDDLVGSVGDNWLSGRGGDDTAAGGDGADTLDGGDGNDTLDGGQGADLIYGGAGSDFLTGGAGPGSDWIVPGGGNDTVDGGEGNDMVSFSDLAETPGRTNLDYRLTIDLGAGTAVSHDGAERMSLLNLERVTGTIFADFIRGDAGANQLRGLGDYDWFLATTGPDTIDGGNGQDMISFVEWRNAAANTIGDAFGPLPPSGAQATGIYLDLTNPANNTNLAAGLELTSIERITGSGRQDVFFGDDQSNDFRGLGDFDWFVGSDGGRERYFGGDGDDTVTYFNAPGAVTASLRNGAVVNGQQTGYGSQGWAARDLYFEIENLVGSAFDDRLTGSEARNQLNGLGGDDFLFGYGGIDYLKGGLGDDTINGGAGSDYALFDGDRASYTLTRSSGTEVTVSGPDGIDSLTNVEYFRFDDMDVTIWDLAIV